MSKTDIRIVIGATFIILLVGLLSNWLLSIVNLRSVLANFSNKIGLQRHPTNHFDLCHDFFHR